MTYILRIKGDSKSHIWNDISKDTLCNLYSTGGLNPERYMESETIGKHGVCHMCELKGENMAIDNWSWKPDQTTAKPVGKSTSNATVVKFPKKKKIKVKKKKKLQPREFALEFFNRGSLHTDNVTLCSIISKEMNWDDATDRIERRAMLRKFYQAHKSVDKPPKKWLSRKTKEQFYRSKGWQSLRYQALKLKT